MLFRSNGQPQLVHELLTMAIAASGGTADPVDLLPVATSIALANDSAGPWLTPAESQGVLGRQVEPVARAARLLAGELLVQLDDDGRRWHHTQAVAARAKQAAHLFSPDTADLLSAAAWLHDIGYARQVNRHDFHPVDGAEHVAEHLAAPAVAGLIAHHSGARFVAEVRGLRHLMVPFADTAYWTGPLADALTWADQTTGPDGQQVTVEERLDEVLTRHGPDSPNARSNSRRAPALIAAVRLTEARLQRGRS